MLTIKVIARLMTPILVATAWQTLVAEEPAPSPAPAPATSIREWHSDPKTTPAAGTTAQGPAKSIREWNPTAAAKPAAKPANATAATPVTAPAAAPAPTPALSAAVPKSPMTISLTSSLRQGSLVVILDDVPIFKEEFHKSFFLFTQTTKWDPLPVASGKHKLEAAVYGTKKKYFSATYDLDVSRTKASELHFVMQGDKLTIGNGS